MSIKILHNFKHPSDIYWKFNEIKKINNYINYLRGPTLELGPAEGNLMKLLNIKQIDLAIEKHLKYKTKLENNPKYKKILFENFCEQKIDLKKKFNSFIMINTFQLIENKEIFIENLKINLNKKSILLLTFPTKNFSQFIYSYFLKYLISKKISKKILSIFNNYLNNNLDYSNNIKDFFLKNNFAIIKSDKFNSRKIIKKWIKHLIINKFNIFKPSKNNLKILNDLNNIRDEDAKIFACQLLLLRYDGK